MKVAALGPPMSSALESLILPLVSVCPFCVSLPQGDFASSASSCHQRWETPILMLSRFSRSHGPASMVSWLHTSWVVRTSSNPHRKKAPPAQDPSQNREAIQLLWV
jgi:hypothetical protein